MKNYAEKLKSPLWQKKRLEILNLHSFRCEECNSETKTLHVHHRFYLKGREPWEYDNDVFQVLCENCHEKKKPVEKEPINEKLQHIIDSLKKEYYGIESLYDLILEFKKHTKTHCDIASLFFHCTNNMEFVIYNIRKEQKLHALEYELGLLELEIQNKKNRK